MPVDLNLYNLTRRGEGEITAVNGIVPLDRAPKSHEFIRSTLGTDYSDLGYKQLVFGTDQTKYPPFTGIAETYAEFVRSGLIVPVQGRAAKVVDANGDLASKFAAKIPIMLTCNVPLQET